MNRLAILALGAAMIPAMASAQSVEEGYPRGGLAVAAIERGDWARAEALLNDGRVDAADPARLINLGQVYANTGREGEALAAWRAALASNRHVQVETLGGRWVSTAQIAREALTRYESARAGN